MMDDQTESVQQRIEKRLRRHVAEDEIESVCSAVLRGKVLRLKGSSPLDIVALRHGVLFVAGTEYAVIDE